MLLLAATLLAAKVGHRDQLNPLRLHRRRLSGPRGLSGGLPSINQGSFGRLPQTPPGGLSLKTTETCRKGVPGLPGDGLSSVGRAKVRAGIRLEQAAKLFHAL